MNLRKTLLLSLSLVILGSVAVLIGTGTVGASPRLNSLNAAPSTSALPVTVTNTPLSVAGTVNANILGTPNVNATLSNASVSVNNAATNPVLVRDVDDPTNNPTPRKDVTPSPG